MVKPHRGSDGRMIRNYNDLFEDIMKYYDKKIGRKKFENDEDLEEYLVSGDDNNNISKLFEQLKNTRGWKKRVTGEKVENVQGETVKKRTTYNIKGGGQARAEYTKNNVLIFRSVNGSKGNGRFVSRKQIIS